MPERKTRRERLAERFNKIYEQYNLSDTDKEVIKYKLQYPQITQAEIGHLLGIHHNHVYKILKKPAVTQILVEYDGDWIEKLERAKDKATNRLIKLIDNPDPKIAIRACEDILGIGKSNQAVPQGNTEIENLLLQLQHRRKALLESQRQNLLPPHQAEIREAQVTEIQSEQNTSSSIDKQNTNKQWQSETASPSPFTPTQLVKPDGEPSPRTEGSPPTARKDTTHGNQP